MILAVLQQAWRDLISGDAGYRADGMDCLCQPGENLHPVRGVCPKAEPYEIKSAREWVLEKSMEPFGFGWICHKLGRDVDAAADGILASAEYTRQNNLSRINRIV